MDSENRYTGIDETISHLIRIKARKLVGYAGFTHYDLPDLEQEFYIVILEHIHKIDHDQGSTQAFLTCLVERHAGKLVKSRQAQCRDWRLLTSLKDDIGVAPENGEVDAPLNIEEVSAIEAIECQMDVEKLIELLPAELVELAHRLMVMSPQDISKKYSIPRTNIYREIEKIRRIFKRRTKNKQDTFVSHGQVHNRGA